MATYSSTQSGNFSASSTWGGSGVPGDGDRFNINGGHTVTVDGSISVPTNGYADSYIYSGGVLFAGSGAGILRMDGRLYIYQGTLHLQDGAHIQITGTSSETHGIWQENLSNASFIAEGSDGMPTTTLNGNHNEGATQLVFTSGTNFAVGEWIGVYASSGNWTSTSQAEQFRDEGFWIHDKNGNTIYPRQYTGPEDVTVVSSSGTTITVTNAKKFKKNQKIIFGTSTNRNIHTISSVNYARNQIVCDGSITGSVAGETVYYTGSEKYHATGDKVRKIATVSTAEVASSSTTITLANANMFTANDEIWIEKRSEADGTTDYVHEDSDDYHHTISSVDGNTITLSAQIGYKVVAGSLVTRLSRNILIETTTPNTDYGFFYSEYFTTNYTKKLVIKDVYFKNLGSNNSNFYQGCVFRGYYSTNSLPVTTSETFPVKTYGAWIEGVTVMNADNHERDTGNLSAYQSWHFKMVACVALYGNDGVMPSWYASDNQANFIISVGHEDRAARIEGSPQRSEFAYWYCSRVYNGARFVIYREDALGIHNWRIDAARYAIDISNHAAVLRRFMITGCRYGILYTTANANFYESFIKGLSGVQSGNINQAMAGNFHVGNFYNGNRQQSAIVFHEHDFEIDAIKILNYNMGADWNTTEQAWLFQRRYDNSNNPAMFESIYLPANTTMKVSCKVKGVSGFSGNYPYLAMTPVINSGDDNILSNNATNSSIFSTARVSTQYTSDMTSGYQTKEITCGPYNYSQILKVGIMSDNSNATEGFYIKDFNVVLDAPYVQPLNGIGNFTNINTTSSVINVKSSPSDSKIRLGGRIK